LFSGHSTWIFFSFLTRVWKHIHLPFSSVMNVADSVSMSSYPGVMSSNDDFYQLSSNLVTIETTNSIFNMSLYEYVVPQTLLSWQRTTLANRMATGGSSWNSIFSKHNSGTYNNQWLIVDYNKFTAKSPTDVLWIVEQIPGLVVGADQTSVLKSQSYWASYNIPFYKEIFDMSGYPQMVAKYGDDFTYNHCPRANIFRRNQTMVQDVEHMKSIMRYNNFEHDPLSEGTGSGAICARVDLNPTGAMPFGCTDSKITSVARVHSGKVEAICGPTADQQPPFSWANWTAYPHKGMPEVFDFPWFTLSN